MLSIVCPVSKTRPLPTFKMQMTYSLLALGSMATMAAALSKADFVYPDTVPMHKRQSEGPAFECHSACGLAIQGAREDNYCENSEWLDNLDGCLDCALEFNIWRYYGRLADLAEPCGIDATPRPVGGASSSSAAPPAQVSTSAASEPTSAEESSSSAAETTTAEEQEPTSSAVEATTTQESSAANVPTTVISVVTSSSAAITEEHSTSAVASSAASGVASASTHPTSPATPLPTPPVSEGAQVLRSGFIAAGVALMLAVNLM
ncbi:hypothetical protein HJFPF1_09665 [Paramyrothecium foliicola]|nr:hypothetical protein HJFPF1_09665 [Paramyrothecium foliicola]